MDLHFHYAFEFNVQAVKMKFLVLLACLSSALAFSVDFANLVPVHETTEWQEAFPEMAKLLVDAPEQARVGRVWNGRPANIGELPYQAGIYVLLTRQAFCGGSLVSNRYVLSAADCYPGNPPVSVSLGSIDLSSNSQDVYNSERVIIHSSFNPANSDNDIALVRLNRDVTFTTLIQPIRLPNRRQITQSFENQQARVSGWGATGAGEAVPMQFLRVAFGQVISQTSCRIRFPSSSSDLTLCIDGVNGNFCSGDFGGPVVVTDADRITTQVGIASFINILGCHRGSPAGITRVSGFLDWIGDNSNVVIRDGF